jgi:hypothetical protein
MAGLVSSEMRAWVEANQGKHPCACGCGRTIPVKSVHRHRGVPQYILGHNARIVRPAAERFWERVVKHVGCWVWTAARDRKGYGRLYDGGRYVLAHRLSWELHNGPVPEGVCVLHNCPGGDNPACVNPAHLFLGTRTDNAADRDAKGRGARGEQNGRSKLTPESVRVLREQAARGVPRYVLAERHGVNRATVLRALSGQSWAHV